MEQAVSYDLPYVAFREPDLNDEITAVALRPGKLAQDLCAEYTLALKDHGTRTQDSGDHRRSKVVPTPATITERKEVASQ